MPRLDGTGPAGMGPMTGGARGRCNPLSPLRTDDIPSGYPAYGVLPRFLGRFWPGQSRRPRGGFGRRGRGRGW